jgi:hypothetical protein
VLGDVVGQARPGREPAAGKRADLLGDARFQGLQMGPFGQSQCQQERSVIGRESDLSHADRLLLILRRVLPHRQPVGRAIAIMRMPLVALHLLNAGF